jgi:trehalose-6-phosphatase
MVSEVRAGGPDNRGSLKDFLNVTPFAGCMPVMLGDDLTDKHTFGAARRTAARYRPAPVAEVRSRLAAGTGI